MPRPAEVQSLAAAVPPAAAARKPLASPLRLAELLHLLRAYQSVIHARPLEMGNREFLVSLIDASLRIGEAIAAAPSSASLTGEIAAMRSMLASQSPANAKEVAGAVVRAIASLSGHRLAEERSPTLYVRGVIPPLPRDYASIVVLFGPALGLGDQIAFLPLLRSLTSHAPGARTTIYTLYPNLWRHLLPDAREVSYRGRPMRPFGDLRARAEQGREIVLAADFECFDLHRRLIPRARGRDVVEVALGRRGVWVNRDDSPWIHFEDFSSASAVFNNYAILGEMSRRLCASERRPAWEPLRPPVARRRGSDRTVFLNPFTAKKYDLEPGDWVRVLASVQAGLPPGEALEVLVHPGLNELSLGYAGQIRELGRRAGLRISVLGQDRGSRPTPFNAFESLLGAWETVDLCLTVDTFTGHLSPLFGIPTVVVTDRENREFWVPAPWSFYCLRDRLPRALGPLVLNVLAESTLGESGPVAQSARTLLTATAGAEATIDEGTITEVAEALRLVLLQLDPGFPYQTQGREWLLLWSRLSAAVVREPVPSAVLVPYLHRWRECEFYKLLAMRTPASGARARGAA